MPAGAQPSQPCRGSVVTGMSGFKCHAGVKVSPGCLGLSVGWSTGSFLNAFNCLTGWKCCSIPCACCGYNTVSATVSTITIYFMLMTKFWTSDRQGSACAIKWWAALPLGMAHRRCHMRNHRAPCACSWQEDACPDTLHLQT